ncbi:co-chaperone GroES [Sinimarinibacterium flocculans]|uniref:co-chaperone GroES n=1 Tax=Sinimarinibacterium flocculans TaxID=985250 RepID=UPI0024902CA6|nr:co-chaperone GroES [Sinimarinibacterium flocculans]
MPAQYTPTLNNVLVRPDKKEEESAGGIILPETDDSVPITHGTVVSVGPEVEGIGPNDNIIYSAFGGVEYELDGETLLVMSIHDIVLTVS